MSLRPPIKSSGLVIDGGVLPNDPLVCLTVKQLWHDSVWECDEACSTKIFLLCIGRFFDDDGRASSMSYSQVACDSSLHESTAKKIAIKVLGRWLTIDRHKGYMTRNGGQNLYHAICPPDIVDRLRAKRTKWRGVAPNDPGKGDGVAQEHPETGNGVASEYPGDERGRPGLPTGSPQATVTHYDSDKEVVEEENTSRARAIEIVDKTQN